MNPLTYLMQRYQARARKQQALRMLMFSGAIRRADRGIRYAMTPKELKKLLHHTKETLCL